MKENIGLIGIILGIIATICVFANWYFKNLIKEEIYKLELKAKDVENNQKLLKKDIENIEKTNSTNFQMLLEKIQNIGGKRR